MDVDDHSRLQDLAVALIRQAAEGYSPKYGYGSMSCAAYDTAWVSLVAKSFNGTKKWLFPQSFKFLLENQENDGSWGRQTSPVDRILNTAAPLLSLRRHAREPLQLHDVCEDRDLDDRIHRATLSLQRQLSDWDIASTAHVGFEIIVPALLNLLAAEGLCFSFKAQDELMKVNAAKLKRFDPEVLLYGKHKTTLLHSLEAFVGIIDFDKVVHHKVGGSFMASPSATAAYLMNASCWDDEAEDYIKNVIVNGSGRGHGAVPSAYPSSNFEYSWLLSTLLHAGFTAKDIECPELCDVAGMLENSFIEGQGTIGFARSISSDADDTAKAAFALNKLGYDISVNEMVKEFEVKNHFQTYPSERDASLSANCNVLLALLHQKQVGAYQPQIFKCVKFLTRCWWNTDGPIRDKWNQSHLYSTMLMVQALTEFQAILDQKGLPYGLNTVEMARVSICLFQGCLRTMLQQCEDGSWSHSREQTAYAVLTLGQARRLSTFKHLQSQIDSAIDQAATFIRLHSVDLAQQSLPEFIWTEKVSYTSPLVTEAYCLAALKVATSLVDNPGIVGESLDLGIPSRQRIDKYIWLFHQTPLFRSLPEWQLRASFIEGHLFLPIVNEHRLDVFPRKNMDPDDDYIRLIPFTWTATNNRNFTFASPAWLYDMIMVSVVDYQADEFMEAVAGLTFSEDLSMLVGLIQEVLTPYKIEPASPVTSLIDMSSVQCPRAKLSNIASGDIEEVRTCLRRFASFFLDHPAVRNAQRDDRATAWREVHNYLVAHVRHTQDNMRLNSQEQRRWYVSRNMPYFHWVRSNDDIACPITFGFVTCLVPYLVANPIVERAVIGNESENIFTSSDVSFDSVESKYYADDVCRHITNVTRIYNDCGSVVRDATEKNLNSVNFPEFAVTASGSEKQALHAMGEYERACCQAAFERLEEASLQTATTEAERAKRRRRLDVWKVFLDTADLYGQIYVVRDFTARSVHVRETGIASTAKDVPLVSSSVPLVGGGPMLVT
ncbi:hypothetical protein N8I77_013625 [Diaporthe amygdali]|uniref:Uncharacterized protein n=1 Tax=Phomopsis amygdali TaxID=1214568 RepID=A0AAD9S1U2_PHOAM|nr:hypothetical protein N8I77_013625 [Diaporthe amygdali]